MGRENLKFKFFDLLRDCYIYRGPIRFVRQIKVGGILEQGNNFAYCNERDASSSFTVGGGRVGASLQIYQQNTSKLNN